MGAAVVVSGAGAFEHAAATSAIRAMSGHRRRFRGSGTHIFKRRLINPRSTCRRHGLFNHFRHCQIGSKFEKNIGYHPRCGHRGSLRCGPEGCGDPKKSPVVKLKGHLHQVLPKVGAPTTTDRFRSWRTAARISAAEALEPLTIVMTGIE